MLIMTTKLSKGKIALALIIAAVLLFVVLRLVSGGDASTPPTNGTAPENVSSNEDRIAYLAAYGCTATGEPVRTQEVSIPKEFNEVFTRYNELQKSQGFNLEDYAGKRAKRYVYQLVNHPDGDAVMATLIVYQDRVIAADISCTEGEGFLRALLPTTGT